MRNHVLANKDPVEDAMQVAPMLAMAYEMLSNGPAGETLTLSSEAVTGLSFLLMLAETSIQTLADMLIVDAGKKEGEQKDSAQPAK